MSVSKIVLLLMSVLLCVAVGCGPSADAGLVAAKGQVTLDGTPVSGVTVTFVPQEGVKGRGGFAVTDSDGRFDARIGNAPGVLPGKYRVLFERLVTSDGNPVPPDVAPADVNASNALPAVYSNPSESPIVATVEPSGSEDLSFELLMRPRR